MSAQNEIDTLATAFNKTVAHLVNKIKFFINADNVKSNFKLKNIVGFTDTREHLRPFHILKYIADNYLDDYDYFVLAPDTTYIDARVLRDKLSHISISFDIYLGTKMRTEDVESDADANYCDLDAGIVLSSSVIRKIRSNLDWCVRNAATQLHSLNIGRCVKYSTKIDQCQPAWQGIAITSYRLTASSHKIYRDFHFLRDDAKFNEATAIFPITISDDFYRLHIYFSRLHLEAAVGNLVMLERNSTEISNGSISNDILEIRWPLGVPPSSIPATRHDLLTWTMLNETHSFLLDSETNVAPLPGIDAADFAKILNHTLERAAATYTGLEFLSVHTAYRRFDPVRGMDYKLLLKFLNTSTRRVTVKAFEAMKPLGMVEIIPSPYVTESTRIAILLPTFEHQVEESLNFIERYEKICMENLDNTFLMLVFLYGAETPSKGDGDVFGRLKSHAINLSEKFKADGSRIAWVSIRLPTECTKPFNVDDLALSSMYGNDEILSLAVTDLALRKIGLDSLVMVASNSMAFKPDFLNRKPMSAKKATKNIIRPRYFSSELGIREKVFIGVMSAQNEIDTLATAFNKTVAHLVNKIKFFINADNVKSNFKLKNIVGFTDTREHLRPFHILKYIADNYLDDYDYFVLAPDTTYIDARVLRDKLSHISISFDIYLGTKMRTEDVESDADANYCDLDAGIVLSSSVIRKIRSNLDWCVRNAATQLHSLNIGRCVKYSTKIDQCQPAWQGIAITSYRLTASSHKIYRDFHFLRDDAKFNEATAIFPITISDDFYRLHIYFSRLHLEAAVGNLVMLERNSTEISNGSISNDILEIRWPLGVPPSSIPATRHDLLTWTMLNETHSFLLDSETNVAPLPGIDAADFAKILNHTLERAAATYTGLEFLSVHTAYRRFDPVRGMDYKLLLKFLNTSTRRVTVKAFEAMKPLGMVEIIPSPYVTESTRIAILLPTFEHQVEESLNFIERYEKICMENLDNTFLMLVFLYGADTPSKGDGDVFGRLKSHAINLSEKFKADGSRIAWVSIRLPTECTKPFNVDDLALSSMYGNDEILSLAVTDLALRKIGLDSLVMVASNSMAFKPDFLNRVRMNTIQGFQVYSAIGFMLYPCRWTGLCKECSNCDVSQSLGYFDRQNFDVVSFYSRDYVEARKKLESSVPIVRSDRDISQLLERTDKSVNSIVGMFIKSDTPIHLLRAVEPNLKFGGALVNHLDRQTTGVPKCIYRDNPEKHGKCIRMGSKKQLGEWIVRRG
uniref:Hexosyltransferase n=1 Tax=Lutzomyia longipalpis TaxID=7200 RepID=A0A7G3AFQ6_LUTLO